MGSEGKIQKVNLIYLVGCNMVAPTSVMVLSVVLGVILPEQLGLILAMVGFVLAVCWWALLGRKIYDGGKKKKLAQLEESGFVPNHTFNGDGCTVVVDLVHGQVALLFRWNPAKVYVRPASALSGVRVDDGRGGVSILEGSSRVSFLFTVEGVTVRVNTFTSNRRWRMDSDYILTGISKADMMAETLIGAGAQAAVR